MDDEGLVMGFNVGVIEFSLDVDGEGRKLFKAPGRESMADGKDVVWGFRFRASKSAGTRKCSFLLEHSIGGGELARPSVKLDKGGVGAGSFCVDPCGRGVEVI